jgi:hypothetical protein
MYSLVLYILALTCLMLTGLLIFYFKNKINGLISWLEVLFSISFFSCIILMFYYTHYYLGESQVLQKIYFGLFYLSVLLLLWIIVLRIIRFFKIKSKM